MCLKTKFLNNSEASNFFFFPARFGGKVMLSLVTILLQIKAM